MAEIVSDTDGQIGVRYVEDTDPHSYIAKVCFNMSYPPLYGGCLYSSMCLVIHKSKPKFRAALRKSLLEEGFRNPILAYECDGGLLLKFGNSRLMIAQDLNIPVPAIVVDHQHRYEDRPEVTNENFAEFFTDVPRIFEISEGGRMVDHSFNLGRRNQHEYDPMGLEWLGEDEGEVLREFGIINRDAHLQDRLRRRSGEGDTG